MKSLMNNLKDFRGQDKNQEDNQEKGRKAKVLEGSSEILI